MKSKKMTGKEFKEILVNTINCGFDLTFEQILAEIEGLTWAKVRTYEDGDELKEIYRKDAIAIHDELSARGYYDSIRKAEA